MSAIVDCGVAPGISNYILGFYDPLMTITDFECMVGGLPKTRVSPFEYKAPFSPIDVIEEYTRPARMMENGVIVTKPALSEPELLDFDKVGTLESFNTDGLRSLLFTKAHIPNMKEKTLRYPGHIGFIQALKKGGFFSQKPILINGVKVSPFDFTSNLLIDQWKSKPDEEEFTIMRIKLSGTQYGKPKTIVYELFDSNDPVTQTSSMSRTTGYTCTATLQLLTNGLFTQKGVFPPELVGCYEPCFDFLMKYLSERKVDYKVSVY